MNKTMVAAAVGLTTLLSTASPVFAQAKQEVYGPVLPMEYDGVGGRHWMEYGYSGPWLPALVWEKGLVKTAPNPGGILRLDHKGMLARNKHVAARSKDAE
jgi:hypothetical protein